MGFDWSNFLELAKYLNDNSGNITDSEACYRSAISRAYYAAFCRANDYIEYIEGKRFTGGGAHFQVREYYKRSKGRDISMRTIANQLETMSKSRKIADYHKCFKREKPRPMAYKTVSMAGKVIDSIKELEKNDRV